jgi:DNA-binding beta-propeller fold protein YncE
MKPFLALLLGASALAAQAPAKDYLFFVASEGNDKIALVRFGPKGATVDHDFRMGTNPTEVNGPHGVAVSPDGRYYFVTTAHGVPNGGMWKFSTAGDSLLGRVTLGSFPATVQVSPNGAYALAVNFNLHGDMVPSSVSVVWTEGMVEIARVQTCTMPHGSRFNPQGTKHYSACMMNDALVEIDTKDFKVSRHFMLSKGSEHGMPGPVGAMAMSHDLTCSPTWAQPSANGASVFVACNKSNEIVEVNANAWAVKRRLPAGEGVYNLATTHDGKLLIGTNKKGQSVSVIDIATGREAARISTTRRLPSGVAVSSDDKYAFVTLEGVGSEPGTVDVIDLATLKRVASVDLGQQAGGIDFWKTIP